MILFGGLIHIFQINRLRHQGAGYGPRRSESRWIPYPSPPANDIGIPFLGSSYDRKVEEIQASLNLIGLKQKPSDDVDKLTSALLVSNIFLCIVIFT